MKIAVFHNLPEGGALRTVYEQVKGLSKNHIIDLYQFDNKYYKDINKFTRKSYVYKFYLHNNLPGPLNRFYKDLKNIIFLYFHHKSIAKDIDNKSYDIVLVHTDMWTESPFILRFLKTPNIYHCHEILRFAYEESLVFDEKVIFIKRIYEMMTRNIRKIIDENNAVCAHSIVTSSTFVQKQVRKVYKKSATVCHPGVDVDIFKPTSSKKTHNLLFIGNRESNEGYDLALNIIKHLPKKEEFKLNILDFKNAMPKIRNDKLLAKEYSSSFIMLCLDHKEPFGLKAIESMSCGTPVFAVNEGGYRESVRHGITGYVLDRKPELFAKKMLSLKRNAKLYNKLSKQCRSDVLKRWQWKYHVKCLEKVMHRIKHDK
jgi:glycosyltransferase involved in cell wall biosynthesis